MVGSSATSGIHRCVGSCILLLHGCTSIKLEGTVMYTVTVSVCACACEYVCVCVCCW